MARANPSSLKRKKSTKLVESEVSSCSDCDTSSEYENIKYETSSESEDEENPNPKISKKEKAKKAKMSSEEKKPEKMKPEKDRKTSKKKIKKKAEAFDESDVKIDMSNESLKPQKIKLASNLLVECRTIVVDEPGVKKFSYPGIVFIRKMKDGNCFEFNIPMAITSRVITALEIMTKDGTSKN
jgi:hypothetical protein